MKSGRAHCAVSIFGAAAVVGQQVWREERRLLPEPIKIGAYILYQMIAERAFFFACAKTPQLMHLKTMEHHQVVAVAAAGSPEARPVQAEEAEAVMAIWTAMLPHT